MATVRLRLRRRAAVAGCGGCGTCSGCLIPCPVIALDNIELFAGTQAFSGPLNMGETASFGFHYGLNWGVPVPCMPSQPFGLQLGYRGVSSNYSGASFTRGLARTVVHYGRRVSARGLGSAGRRGGGYSERQVVLRRPEPDADRGANSAGFSRNATKWARSSQPARKTNEIASTLWVDDQQTTVIEEYEPTDLMAFFYRRRFDAVGGGYARVFGGFTGDSGGLLGADFNLPLTESWALKTNFTYLIPKDGNNRVAYLDEAWNVGDLRGVVPGPSQGGRQRLLPAAV